MELDYPVRRLARGAGYVQNLVFFLISGASWNIVICQRQSQEFARLIEKLVI
jgi:hypothetical protein